MLQRLEKVIITLNWKMNLTLRQAKELSLDIIRMPIDYNKVEISVHCSNIHTPYIARIFKDSHVKVGGQNVSDKERGNYTGETGAFMLKEVGVDSVILGHSERRFYFNEDNYQVINHKIKIALKNNMHVMLCVGESSEEKINQISEMAVIDQIASAFYQIKKIDIELGKIYIIYEPIWATGTGRTVSYEVVERMHNIIRETLNKLYSNKLAFAIPVLYGGSVSQKNINNFLKIPSVSGVLIGRKSSSKNNFYQIMKTIKALQ